MSCLWKNSAVGCTCRCFYASTISLYPLRFCNSCVYTTLALVRSLAFSSNKATNIPVKSQALASHLSFPWCSFLQTPKKLGHVMTPGSCQSVSRNQPLCRSRREAINLCLFWTVFSTENSPLSFFKPFIHTLATWLRWGSKESISFSQSFPLLTSPYCLKALQPEISKMYLLCLLRLLFARNHTKWLKPYHRLTYTILNDSGSYSFTIQ